LAQNGESDQEVLEKEFSLGKDLLKKAIRHINESVLETLSRQKHDQSSLNSL
jgi:hypothetical protein